MINILMVDDHAIVREGLSRIINDTTVINIDAEASTGEESINKINTQKRLNANAAANLIKKASFFYFNPPI